MSVCNHFRISATLPRQEVPKNGSKAHDCFHHISVLASYALMKDLSKILKTQPPAFRLKRERIPHVRATRLVSLPKMKIPTHFGVAFLPSSTYLLMSDP